MRAKWLLIALAIVVACSGSRNTGDDADTTATATSPATTDASTTSTSSTTSADGSSTTTPSTSGAIFDVGGTGGETDGACTDRPETDATLTGAVYAPNQIIPVSGALVYASVDPPDPIPDQVYCAECVELPCSVPFTLTESDGSFSLPVPSGQRHVVVQKGQFLRGTQVDIAPGANALDVDVTSLPDHRDEANHLYIPNIALAWGAYDRLEDALGKLGLADTIIDVNTYTEDFVPGTEQFDSWENGATPEGVSLGTFADLAMSASNLEKYHIIFIPCSTDPYESVFGNQMALQNIRDWVAAGGKWYVADWSNEYLDHPFGQYQTFFTDDWGDTDVSSYDSLGTVLDADLLAWLQALPAELKDINPLNGGGSSHPKLDLLPQIQTVDNWSGIQATPPVMVDDGQGGMVDVGHKTWIEGPGDDYDVPSTDNPLTVTGEYGCGKIMFTTYHMAEFTSSYVGLTPQELVLLYLILEIGVCQTPYDPPG